MEKKQWIILLLLIFGLSQIFAEPCGDVDSNGAVNIIDALMTAQYYVGLNPPGFDTVAAEVSGDGKINIIDALQIAQYYVGLISSFAGCTQTPTPTNGSETYELQAETEATWDNAAVDDGHAGYTGSGFVDTVNASGTWIQWSLDIASATQAVCDFRYACASSARSMDLIVNGTTVASLLFAASGAWDTWATEEAPTINLIAGSNTIRLTATTSGGAPNMDKMDITMGSVRVTPTPTPVPTPTPEPTPIPSGWTPGSRLRVIVSSDIGGTDNDDYQSMVHFFTYADVVEVEGIISSPWGSGRVSHILDAIAEYEKDYSKLLTYSSDYPAPDYLRSVSKQGSTSSASSPGYSASTEGSNWIIECARRDDPRPLWILIWGGLCDLPQALHDAPDIENKIRVYWIGGPNKKYSGPSYSYMSNNFKNLWFIEANSTYRGMFEGGNQSGDLGNDEFMEQHVNNHGALGNYCYDMRDNIKMGDTPSLLYVLNNDLDDPTKPGWGGAFIPKSGFPNWWTDNPDPQYEDEGFDGAKTVNIWREEFLRDWQARMDRCQTANQ